MTDQTNSVPTAGEVVLQLLRQHRADISAVHEEIARREAREDEIRSMLADAQAATNDARDGSWSY